MGARFKLEHANIVAFVTSRSYGAPRVRRSDLSEFLEALAYNSREFLISEHGFESWSGEVAEVASRALSRLNEIGGDREREVLLHSGTVEKLLDELRSELSDYPLFALAVGKGKQLRKVAESLARVHTYGQLLVLIPEHNITERNFEVLDPIPTFSTALHAAANWPGILFWTVNGLSAFAPLADVDELTHALVKQLRSRSIYFRTKPTFKHIWGLDRILFEWSRDKPSNSRRLLHLSDLHFGTDDAVENQPLLNAELHNIVKSVDRVVITGDLFDTPNKNYASLFTAFQGNITRLASGLEPIVITGNHDQRMIGLFGDNYKQVASICPMKVIVDDHSHMIFICFNSSEEGSFARGKITQSQFRHLGGEYRTLIAARPELKQYLPIVLVHHHPFSFDVQPETWIQRALSKIGLRDELFLEMANAEDLHHWCLDWKVKTILHGHKHKARYVERKVSRDDGSESMLLTAIGCGSSLGAEGSPVSYNMLEWEPQAQRWVVSFFESINGGAFREIVASVSPQRTE